MSNSSYEVAMNPIPPLSSNAGDALSRANTCTIRRSAAMNRASTPPGMPNASLSSAFGATATSASMPIASPNQ